MEEMNIVDDISIGRAVIAAAKRTRAAGSAPKARLEALAMIEKENLITPLGIFRFLRICEVRDGWFYFEEGLSLHAPALAPLSSQLRGVTAIACTLGPAFDSQVSSLCADRRLSLSLALDVLGNELLMYISCLVARKSHGLVRQWGPTVGGTLTPVETDLPLDQQMTVLTMAGGECIGITVKNDVPSPVKSRAFIMGVGDGLSKQLARLNCEDCFARGQCTRNTL
jgi:hypothetical protein